MGLCVTSQLWAGITGNESGPESVAGTQETPWGKMSLAVSMSLYLQNHWDFNTT
jgi:hypothetical protein